MINDSYLDRNIHKKTHNRACELKLASNHKIVLTTEDSERILLLVRVNTLDPA